MDYYRGSMSEEYVNIKLSSFFAEKMDKLVEEGQFTSRADVVREALTLLFKSLEEEEKPKLPEEAA